MKKITVEECKVGQFERCLKLTLKRGHMTEVDITEAIAKHRYAGPSYLQIIVNPEETGEIDVELYNEGHTVILYPFESFAKTYNDLIAPRQPKMVDGHRHCPWCDYELADDMSFCPYCGQRVSGEK